jgi:hypothetical protein
MKRISRILLAVMAVGIFAIGAQSQSAHGGGGGTGEVIIISG